MLVIGFPLLRSTSAKVNISYGNSQVNPKVACHGTIRSRVGRLRMSPREDDLLENICQTRPEIGTGSHERIVHCLSITIYHNNFCLSSSLSAKHPPIYLPNHSRSGCLLGILVPHMPMISGNMDVKRWGAEQVMYNSQADTVIRSVR